MSSQTIAMFDAISRRYDWMNRCLSLGLDKVWRRSILRHLPAGERLKVLDCATGTGDQLLTLLHRCPRVYDAVGIDPSEEMLKIAAEKLRDFEYKTRLAIASAEKIPFPDETFDAITLSFGIRNVADLGQSLKELYRVLLPKGRALILEFSHPKVQPVRFFHRLYLKYAVPRLGALLAKNEEAYSYLAKTIEAFPQGKELCKILEHHGFNVHMQPLSFGIVTLYICEK